MYILMSLVRIYLTSEDIEKPTEGVENRKLACSLQCCCTLFWTVFSKTADECVRPSPVRNSEVSTWKPAVIGVGCLATCSLERFCGQIHWTVKGHFIIIDGIFLEIFWHYLCNLRSYSYNTDCLPILAPKASNTAACSVA